MGSGGSINAHWQIHFRAHQEGDRNDVGAGDEQQGIGTGAAIPDHWAAGGISEHCNLLSKTRKDYCYDTS